MNRDDKRQIEKNKIYKFLTWIFSNLVWTIITFILPFGIVIPRILNFILLKAIKLTLYDIFGVAVFVSIEIVLIFLCYMIKKSLKSVDSTPNKESIPDNDVNLNIADEYDNLEYYFEQYHKHLTVYKNGNGIIINSFIIVVNDINSITKFKREINIEDAKECAVFPSLKDMKKTNLKYRFEKFCFRCKCINNNDLIHSIEEKYWTADSDNDDEFSKNNPKVLKWILKMNPSSIEIGKPYKIVYVISIPNMFPVENGFFKECIANKKGTHGKFSSQLTIKHKVKHFIYTVSFENGLRLYKKPTGKIIDGRTSQNIHYENDNNIIYDKYIFRVDDFNVGNSINIEWCFKEENVNNNKNGGKSDEENA